MANQNQKLLGVLVEHTPVDELSTADKQYWIQNGSKLARVLAEALKRNEVADVVAEAATQTITVLAGFSLADRIAAGRYENVHPSFMEQNFPHDPTSVGEWEWKIPSEKTVATIFADGWQPATLEHLLAFGQKYPDEQRKVPIIGLGSSCVLTGDRVVPGLCGDDAGRTLDLAYSDGLDVNYRLFAVRKKV